MVRPHFQAVILAGGLGRGLQPLTKVMCKPTLPIANLPMIAYSLAMLRRDGFSDIIIVVRDKYEDNIHDAIKSAFGRDGSEDTSKLYSIARIPDDTTMGTADVLRMLYENNQIQSDVVLVPCDLICTVPFAKLLNIHHLNDATVTMLLSKKTKKDAPLKKSRKEYKIDPDIFGLADSRVYIKTTEMKAVSAGQLEVSKHAATRAGTIAIRRDLEDSHVYILRKWVVKMIAERHQFSSVSQDVVPYLVRKQFAPPRRHRNDVYNFMPEVKDNGLAKLVRETRSHEPEEAQDKAVREALEELLPSSRRDDRIRCHALVLEKVHGLQRKSSDALYCCTRIRTLDAFSEINRGMRAFYYDLIDSAKERGLLPCRASASFEESNVGKSARRPPKKQKGKAAQEDTEPGAREGVFIGENSVVKGTFHATVFGHDCEVEDSVIRGSTVMNNVSIGAGCTLTNVCVCDNARLEPGCQLRNCNVAPGDVVSEGRVTQGDATTPHSFI